MNYARMIPLFFLLFVLSSSAIAQSQVCSLTTYWVLRDQGPFISRRFLVGQFPLVLGDKPITKVFHDGHSGLDIAVGVDSYRGGVSPHSPQDPNILRVALVFASKPDNVFNAIGHVRADSVYDEYWQMVSVSKSFARTRRLYTFTFGCEHLSPKKRPMLFNDAEQIVGREPRERVSHEALLN